MSETLTGVVGIGGEDYMRKPNSIGIPLPNHDIKYVDEAGKEVKTGEIGELLIKGPQVLKEYFERPEANAKSFKDGYFMTGDLGKVDEEGFHCEFSLAALASGGEMELRLTVTAF